MDKKIDKTLLKIVEGETSYTAEGLGEYLEEELKCSIEEYFNNYFYDRQGRTYTIKEFMSYNRCKEFIDKVKNEYKNVVFGEII